VVCADSLARDHGIAETEAVGYFRIAIPVIPKSRAAILLCAPATAGLGLFL
jgi:hypothetical protein